MKVELLKNLGSRDAAKIPLKQEECQEGCEISVSEDVAQWLIESRLAKPIEEEKPIKAIPEKPVAAKPVETLKGKTESDKRGK